MDVSRTDSHKIIYNVTQRTRVAFSQTTITNRGQFALRKMHSIPHHPTISTPLQHKQHLIVTQSAPDYIVKRCWLHEDMAEPAPSPPYPPTCARPLSADNQKTARIRTPLTTPHRHDNRNPQQENTTITHHTVKSTKRSKVWPKLKKINTEVCRQMFLVQFRKK